MKSMNKKEGKKIAVMAAVIMGLMMFAFMPMASAGVTSFTVMPSTGIAGAVDSYDIFVITDGVTTIDITIPAGFLAVAPTTGGVEVARVDFWNESTKAYYGHATITSNNANPATEVDIRCEFGGDKITTTQPISYAAGATNPFESGFPSDTSSAIIKLPTETENGSIKISINCTAFQLDAVMIDMKQFVRNPLAAGDYDFFADGMKATVSITEPEGAGYYTIFRNGVWYVDTDGDQIPDKYYYYGVAGDIALVGDYDHAGIDDKVIFRNGLWYVDTNGDDTPNIIFWYGMAGDIPLIEDLNNDETEDIAVFRAGLWYVDTDGNYAPDMWIWYGMAGDIPLVGDFNNDETDDIAVFRNGLWYVDTDGNYAPDMWIWYGMAGDIPLVGDFNNDGTDDIAVFRNGLWYIDTTGDSIPDLYIWYGMAGDQPLYCVI